MSVRTKVHFTEPELRKFSQYYVIFTEVLHHTFHLDLKEETSMASILTLIFHGWLLLEEKHVEVAYISEAHSMLSCLFFPLFL